MKFFILNSSGNVGKTTITREVIYPSIPNAKIFEIETVNSSSEHFSGLNVEKITDFSNFEDIYLKILETDNLILDVGASNLSNFLEKLGEFAGVEELFDFFIIPTVPGDKVATDTARTILYLKSIGIENEKIKVIFNNADSIENFNILFLQEDKIGYKFDKNLFIPKSKLFTELGLLRCTISDIYNSDVDSYKNDIISAPANEKLRLIKKDLANRMAVAMLPKLKLVFENLTGIVAKAEEQTTKKPVSNPTPKPVIKEEQKEQEQLINDSDEDL